MAPDKGQGDTGTRDAWEKLHSCRAQESEKIFLSTGLKALWPEANGKAARMLNIVGAILSGLVIGALARWLYPGPVELGWMQTILLGIGGSLLAGLVATRGRGGFDRAGCLASVLGAMALIFLARWLAG